MIPERFHFVWSGRRFPYFARLAIESVLVVEPTATVELHVFGAKPDARDLAVLTRHARFSVREFDPAIGFKGLGVNSASLSSQFELIPRKHTSARANLVRYAVLARYGGIYLDTDVLAVRSFDDLRVHTAFVGEERVLSIDNAWQAGERALSMIPITIAWAIGRASARAAASLRSRFLARAAAALEPLWQVSQANNAVIGAEAGCRFVTQLLEQAARGSSTVRYALGPALVDRVARENPRDVVVVPPDVFYVVPPSYSFRFFTGGVMDLPTSTRVLHVVSSNHGPLLAALDADEILRRAEDGIYYAHACRIAARAMEMRS